MHYVLWVSAKTGNGGFRSVGGPLPLTMDINQAYQYMVLRDAITACNRLKREEGVTDVNILAVIE